MTGRPRRPASRERGPGRPRHLAMLGSGSVSLRACALSHPHPPAPVASSSVRNLGLRLLGVWLLLWALFRFVDLSFAYDHLVLPLLGLVAGVLLIVGS